MADSSASADAGSEVAPATDTPSVDTSSSASESTPDTSTSTATESNPAAAADGQTDSQEVPAFDWDAWDGTHDALPENLREFGPKFEAYYNKAVNEAMEGIKSLRARYEAMLAGDPDPRLAELQAQLETESAGARELRQKLEQLEQEHKAYVAQVEAHAEAQAKAVADQFKAKHAWIFESEALQNLGAQLVDEGFDYGDLPVLLKMPPKVLDQARAHLKDLTAKGAKGAGGIAIQLVQGTGTRQPRRPPTAAAVNGSHGSGNTSSATDKPDYMRASVSDIVRDSFRRFNAGRG